MACGVSRYAPGVIAKACKHVAIRSKVKKRHRTGAAGRWRNLTEADGTWRKQKMASKALGSAAFSPKFGTCRVEFSKNAPRHHLGPQTCCRKTHGPEATWNGRWRKPGNFLIISRIGIFSPQIWPMACWVFIYALPTSSSWPPEMLPSSKRTRRGPKWKLTEDSGS